MANIYKTLNRFVSQVTRRHDILLAGFLVSIIFMMILPLPTWLADLLIAVNMSLSAILLMIAMYLPTPLAFSSFPSVLLVTTLFRLALSISTTRLILLQANAGDIVFTFGNFVVGGNLVVGLIIFLIITIVQFVVITKGAERVAEVAARFSLDAMPGKQMSIDGDMRAGSIDLEEAKRRRTAVEKESQLYGAMDGAMKFVKGDAIAGLIIVAVNLVGGIVIGSLQRGMELNEAVAVYSILTIGDGLVGQIPALFISICSGIIVTRVQSGDALSNVGQDIGSQILGQPKALMIGGGVAMGFALIPGMPSVTFMVLAILIGSMGLIIMKSAQIEESERAQKEAAENNGLPAMPASMPSGKKSAGGTRGGVTNQLSQKDLSPTVPLILDLAPDLEKVFSTEQLNEELVKIRRALYLDLGVPFPGIQMRFNSMLPSEAYSILLSEVPVSQGRLRLNYSIANEKPSSLSALKVSFEEDKKFLPNIQTLWVKDDMKEILQQAGMSLLDASHILSYHIAFILKQYSSDFVGIQETRFLLSLTEERFPDLIKEVARVVPIQRIAEVFRRLISEDVSIRNLRTVLESLVEWGQKEKDTVLLTEYVRTSLKRHISYKHARGRNILPAYLLAPKTEDAIRAAVRQTSAGSYLALDPKAHRVILNNIKKLVGKQQNNSGVIPVLLTSMDLRRYLRKMIEQDLYEVPVLSYQELTQEINIQPMAKVDMTPT